MNVEGFIYQQERAKVKSYNLPKSKQVTWDSSDKGDCLGYDILSFDKEGNEKYIEVKTTTAKESTSLYITANELAVSEKNPDHYYLYRVYNFDRDRVKGYYSVKRGLLSDLCVSAQIFKDDFE